MSGSSSSTYLKRGYRKHATVITITNTPNKMVINAIPRPGPVPMIVPTLSPNIPSTAIADVRIKGRTYYMKAGDNLDNADEKADEVILLPEYDSYLMGHKDKSQILNEDFKSQVFLPLASVAPAIVKNGHIIGTWNMKKKGKSLLFQINPFEEFKEFDISLVHNEIKKIAHFMDLKYHIFPI